MFAVEARFDPRAPSVGRYGAVLAGALLAGASVVELVVDVDVDVEVEVVVDVDVVVVGATVVEVVVLLVVVVLVDVVVVLVVVGASESGMSGTSIARVVNADRLPFRVVYPSSDTV